MTATSARSLSPYPHGPALTLGELRDLDVPLILAARLSTASFGTQTLVLRKLAGLPFRPTTSLGLTIRVDRQGFVLSIDRG